MKIVYEKFYTSQSPISGVKFGPITATINSKALEYPKSQSPISGVKFGQIKLSNPIYYIQDWSQSPISGVKFGHGDGDEVNWIFQNGKSQSPISGVKFGQ